VLSSGVTGAGTFSAIDLRKVLAGTIARVSPIIGDTEEGLSGMASPKNLETLFQLIHLTFTAPRADADAFAAHLAQGKAMLANQQASPQFAFMQALQAALTSDHPRARQMTTETIDQMNLEKSLAFYRDRFADASDFTFVFVGSFTLDGMRPLVTRYLATLPSLKRVEKWKDVGIQQPKGVVEKIVRKGVEPQSRVAIAFTGPFEYTRDQRVAIRAVSLLLQSKLRERVREELGGTYGVGVTPGYTVIPRQEYSFSIQFACDPKRVGELTKVVFDEIEAQEERPDGAAGERHAPGVDPRVRDEQPAERLPAEPDLPALPGARRPGAVLRPRRVLQDPRRQANLGCGAPVRAQ
jgi:zinc protease